MGDRPALDIAQISGRKIKERRRRQRTGGRIWDGTARRCRLRVFKNSLNTFASTNPAMRSRAGVLEEAGCGMAGGCLWDSRWPAMGEQVAGCGMPPVPRRGEVALYGIAISRGRQRRSRRRLGSPAMDPLRGADDGVYDGGNGGLYGGAPAVADQAASPTAYAALSHSAPYAHSRSHKAAAGWGGRMWEERWPAMGEGPDRE